MSPNYLLAWPALGPKLPGLEAPNTNAMSWSWIRVPRASNPSGFAALAIVAPNAKNDDMIQALAADRSDQPFNKAILPQRLGPPYPPSSPTRESGASVAAGVFAAASTSSHRENVLPTESSPHMA